MALFEDLVPRDFRRSLVGPLRRFFTCTFANSLGAGLTLSFWVVYLHNVRGFSITFATGLLAVSAIVGLAAGTLWGTLTDLLGPFRVMILGYAGSTGSLAAWAFIHTPWQAASVGLVLAALGGAGWGPAATMLTRMTSEEHRQRAFGFNFMLINLGIGFGTLVSALIVDLHHPVTFTILYLADAAVTLLTGLYFLGLRPYGQRVIEHHDDPEKAAEGWREVIADTRLVRYVIATLVLMIGGYGSQEAGLSLFLVNNVGVSAHVIGIIFFFNTTTIVLSQMWVLNRLERRSRSRIMALVGLFWFTFWMLAALALALPKFIAVASLCVGMVAFAIGETMLQPVAPAIVNDIAPEHLRGRYNAASGVTWGLAGTVSPLITALLFGQHLGNWWPASVGLFSLAGSALLLNLRRHLNAAEDGREVAT